MTDVRLRGPDDATPVAYYDDGEPRYALTEVDARFEALLDRYPFTWGHPESERMAVANAFHAVVASENLSHADDAVDALESLLAGEPDAFTRLLLRYDDENGASISDRRDISTGFRAVVAPENRAHAAEAVDVLRGLVD